MATQLKYPKEQIAAAQRLYAGGMSLNKLAEETGIPRTVLRRRIVVAKLTPPEQGTVKVAAKQLEDEEKNNPRQFGSRRFAYQVGIEKASEHLADRLVSIINKLFDVAENSLDKTNDLVKRSNSDDSKDFDAVSQLKYLVPVWTSAINATQLLTGKPTERIGVGVVGKIEHDVNLRILEYTDVYRQLAQGRGVLRSNNEGHNSGEPVGKERTN